MAVTEIVDVTGIEVDDGVLSTPPQEVSRPRPTKAKMTTQAIWKLRRRVRAMRQPATTSAAVGNSGRESGREAAACALTVMVRVLFAALPAGVTVAGLNEQETPAGSPEQAKLTAELKPFRGVTVSRTAPCAPEFTVSKFGAAPNAKVGGGLIT
jgi:hypothetical protein